MRTFRLFVVACCLATLAAPLQGGPKGRTLLAVFAHPDDETVVGPVLARYAREGATVYLAVATGGQKGVREHAGIPAGEALADARAAEVRCAAEALGIEPPILLGFEDGELGKFTRPPQAHLHDLAAAIRGLFEKIRPDVVITWGPDGLSGHPDHRLTGAVVAQVFQTGGEGWPRELFVPGLPASRAGELPGPLAAYAVEDRFLVADIAFQPEDFAAHRKAIECHRSQWTPEEMAQHVAMTERL